MHWNYAHIFRNIFLKLSTADTTTKMKRIIFALWYSGDWKKHVAKKFDSNDCPNLFCTTVLVNNFYIHLVSFPDNANVFSKRTSTLSNWEKLWSSWLTWHWIISRSELRTSKVNLERKANRATKTRSPRMITGRMMKQWKYLCQLLKCYRSISRCIKFTRFILR